MKAETLKTTRYIGSVDSYHLYGGKKGYYFTLEMLNHPNQIKCILNKSQVKRFLKLLDWADTYIKVSTNTKPEAGKKYAEEIIATDFGPDN